VCSKISFELVIFAESVSKFHTQATELPITRQLYFYANYYKFVRYKLYIRLSSEAILLAWRVWSGITTWPALPKQRPIQIMLKDSSALIVKYIERNWRTPLQYTNADEFTV